MIGPDAAARAAFARGTLALAAGKPWRDVTIFDIADMKKSGASIQPGDRSELAFTRAMLAAAESDGKEHRHEHSHGGGCLCGFIAKLGTLITEENR